MDSLATMKSSMVRQIGVSVVASLIAYVIFNKIIEPMLNKSGD